MAASPLRTYSFLNIQGSIIGPGGSFGIGSGVGAAEEGITVEPAEDLDTLTVGADGAGMHSLSGNQSGKVTVRVLKTSDANAQLQSMLNLQRISAAAHGQNTITFTDSVSGDVITAQGAAFARQPTITYAKDGGMNEWTFNVSILIINLGAGVA